MLFYVSEISEAGYNNSNLAATTSTVAKIKNVYKKRDTGDNNVVCELFHLWMYLTNTALKLSDHLSEGVLGIAAGDQMTNCECLICAGDYVKCEEQASPLVRVSETIGRFLSRALKVP